MVPSYLPGGRGQPCCVKRMGWSGKCSSCPGRRVMCYWAGWHQGGLPRSMCCSWNERAGTQCHRAQISYLQLPEVAFGQDAHTSPDRGIHWHPLLGAVTVSAPGSDPAEPPKEVMPGGVGTMAYRSCLGSNLLYVLRKSPDLPYRGCPQPHLNSWFMKIKGGHSNSANPDHVEQ